MDQQPVNKTVDKSIAFSFGDPEPVLDKGIGSYFECVGIGGLWWSPFISPDGLARMVDSAAHHASPIYFKRNVLASTLRPHPLMSRSLFLSLAQDYLVFGNSYLVKTVNRFGKVIKLDVPRAKYIRKGIEAGKFFQISSFYDYSAYQNITEYEFQKDMVFQFKSPDISQEIYGRPEYMAALNSALLNEAATLFRRKYYANGSHAGFILYVTDPAKDEDDIDNLRASLKAAKGPGNFRNLFYYSPNGKEKGVQLIPIGEVAAKDEFTGIKNASRDDLLAIHRVPPQLMGMLPNAAGGFGDVEKAARVFARNEIEPLQGVFTEANDWLGEEVFRFDPYVLPSDPAPQVLR